MTEPSSFNDCKDDYICLTYLRPLHHRIHKLGQPSRGGEVFEHKTKCKFQNNSHLNEKRKLTSIFNQQKSLACI